MLIDVTKVSKDFGFGEVFGSLSFSVNNMDRIALVGRNGCGKSTLLKIISSRETPTTGSVVIAKGLRIAMLDQTSADMHDDRIVEEILREPFAKFDARQKSLDDMQSRMTMLFGAELDKLVEKYSDALEKFVADGGYDIEQNINYVVNGLKINTRIRNQNYSTLSGGEKTLVQFARILLDNPDVLLLDEPTNHLDIERIEWLEGYIQKFKGAVIVVSHDRYFLDKIASVIIDVEDGQRYVGNYTYYVKEKENRELREFEQYKNEQKKLAELKKAVERLYAWGEKADNPSMFRRAKAIQKRIDVMEENAIKKPEKKKDLPINMRTNERGSDVVFDVQNLSLILGDKIIFDDANFQMRNGDKIALVGANGMGKTTLIKCLLGDITDYMGTIKVGNSIKLGYLPQLLTFDNEKETILEYVTNTTGYKEEPARRLLAKFDFYKNDIDKKLGSLSGGEKVRIKLACMLTQDINTFVFDEPTNHIDIFTRETLEKAMSEFKGNILFVSHDRYFIDKVANGILELSNNKLKLFRGNYTDFKNKDIKVEDAPKVPVVKIKPPKISKGGKW